MSDVPVPLLEVRDLRMSFGGRKVLDGISFQVAPGEFLGIMGGSGGGKSTILKSIIGLIRPDEGRVFFEGQDLSDLSERELARIRPDIGFVFQNGALFDSMTVEENVSYPLVRHTQLSEEEILERVNERLRMVGLEDANELYPNELSGGMLKRAGLIRATILDPKLVLLDEPTAGLDPLNVRNFVKMALRIKKERGLSGIFVSHDALAVLALCDRVGILWEGRLWAMDFTAVIRRSQDPVVRSFIEPEALGFSPGLLE